ncbi:MAG: ferrous iron transport protein A [Hydrogenophaga sp.]
MTSMSLPMSTLNQLPLRQWHRVATQGAGHPRLRALGFLPLENVRVLQRGWWPGGALVVQVGDAVFGLRPDEAAQVPVQATAP